MDISHIAIGQPGAGLLVRTLQRPFPRLQAHASGFGRRCGPRDATRRGGRTTSPPRQALARGAPERTAWPRLPVNIRMCLEHCSAHWGRVRGYTQAVDPVQNACEDAAGHRHLGQLDVTYRA